MKGQQNFRNDFFLGCPRHQHTQPPQQQQKETQIESKLHKIDTFIGITIIMKTAPNVPASPTMKKNDPAASKDIVVAPNNTETASIAHSSASASSSDDEDDLADLAEAIDKFDSDRGRPTVSIESSSTPFVLEMAPRNGGFTKDPLFQANTLYEGEMSTQQVDAYCSKTILASSSRISSHVDDDERRSSWTDSVVRLLTGSGQQ